MPTRTSFQKRQKELLRAERARDKAAKRLARKEESKARAAAGLPPLSEMEDLVEEQPLDGEPQDESPAP